MRFLRQMYKNGFRSNNLINYQEIANGYDMSFSMSESPPNKRQRRSPSPVNRPNSTCAERAPASPLDLSRSSSSWTPTVNMEQSPGLQTSQLNSLNSDFEEHSSNNQLSPVPLDLSRPTCAERSEPHQRLPQTSACRQLYRNWNSLHPFTQTSWTLKT
jgi:hypothetical protein